MAPDRLLDGLERRPFGRGRRPRRDPRRRPGDPGRVRRQRRHGPLHPGSSRGLGGVSLACELRLATSYNTTVFAA